MLKSTKTCQDTEVHRAGPFAQRYHVDQPMSRADLMPGAGRIASN
jgi:hypothetical protein